MRSYHFVAEVTFKYENLSVSLIPLLEWILDSNWSQKVVQFKAFPSNGEITDFGNLQFISSTELDGVEGWGENVKLFSTADCVEHLSTGAITWKEICSLFHTQLRILLFRKDLEALHQSILPF